MIANAKIKRCAQRVFNILNSINEDIGKYGALQLIDEDGAFPSFIGLRRNTLRMLDEAKARSKAYFKAQRVKIRAAQKKKANELGISHDALLDRNAEERYKKRQDDNKVKREKARKGKAGRKLGHIDHIAQEKAAGRTPMNWKDFENAEYKKYRDKEDAAGRKPMAFRHYKHEGDPEGYERQDIREKKAKKRQQVKGRVKKFVSQGKKFGSDQGVVSRSIEKEGRTPGYRGDMRVAGGPGRLVPGRRGRPDKRVPDFVRAGSKTGLYGQRPGEFAGQEADKKKGLDWLEKERQRRSAGERGRELPGPTREFERRLSFGGRKASVLAKAGKLARMRRTLPHLRDRDHDAAKGYDPDEPMFPGRAPSGSSKLGHSLVTSKKDGHHIDKSGKEVHSSGKSSNKKFANATTFRDSDDDAMLHTDKSKKGSRATASDSEFAFKGNVKKDPRQKWYRVSKQGGYASAMASLGKSYHKAGDMRSKVIAKVKSTGFVDGDGHQINVKPTGAMHNERGACVKQKNGELTALGKHLKKTQPSEFYRLCKGSHGPSGTPDRNEYERGFDPKHDDAKKINRLHKAAERGKADIPGDNIEKHALARPGRAQDVRDYVRGIGQHAARFRNRNR